MEAKTTSAFCLTKEQNYEMMRRQNEAAQSLICIVVFNEMLLIV